MTDTHTFFQVQPLYADQERWTALSRREGLSFEALEFCFAPEHAGEPERLRWYGEGGRTRSVHGAFIDVNPASGDAGFRQLSRLRCAESCRLAQSLGAERVVFHSSCFPFLRGGYLDRWADACAEFYTELAETFRLEILVENSQDVDPEPLCALMKRTGHPLVNVCLDVGHAAYSAAEPEAWFGALGGRIRCLHLSDNLGRFDDHLPLGDGVIDWALTDRLWRQLNRPMPVTLEVGGPEGVEKSLAFLRSRGYFGTEVTACE